MKKCVHTEHCCVLHGCAYWDDDCPVELGLKRQSYPCENCGMGRYVEQLLDEAFNNLDEIHIYNNVISILTKLDNNPNKQRILEKCLDIVKAYD